MLIIHIELTKIEIFRYLLYKILCKIWLFSTRNNPVFIFRVISEVFSLLYLNFNLFHHYFNLLIFDFLVVYSTELSNIICVWRFIQNFFTLCKYTHTHTNIFASKINKPLHFIILVMLWGTSFFGSNVVLFVNITILVCVYSLF